MAKPCVICKKELADVFDDVENQPSGGTSFSSGGHYGSTVWDPMSSDLFLEINICDPCLKANAEEGNVLLVKEYRPLHTNEDWKP